MWLSITETLRGMLGPAQAEKFIKWVIGLVTGGTGPTPAQAMRQDPTPDKDAYQHIVAFLHERMWKWALGKENACEVAAMGHTHFDEYRRKELKGRSYVNCGAFDGNGNTYVEISNDGVRLRRWG
jgi:UDP-2,3-diacylglucosamine pyrophosphatase LpxH